ncbi:MAG TPA: CHAT domain-containing protein [Vicinamibacterales bacterium]|nr:CHAT domain-containing protein [Vicinamibacterales bacterium]
MPLRTLTFDVAGESGRFVVQLSVDGGPSVTGTFDDDLLGSARIRAVIDDIEQGRCKPEDLQDVGTLLWDALLVDEVARVFDRTRDEAKQAGDHLAINLCLPPSLELLPWESLYDERQRVFVAIEPRYSIVRGGTDSPPVSLPPRAPGQPLSVLAVIPEGSGLLVDHEYNNLRLAVSLLGDAIRLERLDGRVTATGLLNRIRSEPWDVVHYIGHGEIGANDTVRIRLNGDRPSETEVWCEAEQFSTLFLTNPPRLVLLNCCLGGVPDPRRTFGGIGQLIIRRGVAAVISMRYEIQDDLAIKLADAFYRELLRGETPGRVDMALRYARHAIYLEQKETSARGFVTPILHLAPGCEALFELPARPADTVRDPQVAGAEASIVPAELLQALADNECVLVLGALAGPAGLRSGAATALAVPGPRELALQLATDSNYPLMTDFELARSSDSWLVGWILQAVCQHFQKSHRRRRAGLVHAIQQAYQQCAPRDMHLAIARWNTPGIIYTYFDGMMAEAFNTLRKTVRLVPSLESSVEAVESSPLLIHLRGSIKDERSLVLTEEDHERLLESMRPMPSHIVELARGRAGRSVLFLGVSPRDPLIRHLSSQLLETGKNRLQGPVFFAYPNHTPVDDAYWDKYEVNWIDLSPEALVAAICHKVGGP